MGQFALSWCGSQTVGGAPDEIFVHILNGRNGYKPRLFLEVKKEIPQETSQGLPGLEII